MDIESGAAAERPRREPVFNAPWPVLALVAALIAAHAWRAITGGSVDPLALTRADLIGGRWSALVTYQFAHGSWTHVLMNAVFCLAFGTPVARFLSTGLRGALTFFGLFFVCGIVAGLGYAVLYPAGGWVLIGGSGAASGLMGGAARLMQGRGVKVGSMFGRTAMAMTISWILVNVLLGASGLTPGAAGLPVAWQAHIIGYFAGLLLMGWAAWLAGAPYVNHAIEH